MIHRAQLINTTKRIEIMCEIGTGYGTLPLANALIRIVLYFIKFIHQK